MRSAWRDRSSRSAASSTSRTIGRSGSTTQPSHVPNDEPAGIDSEPGMCAGGVRRAATARRRRSGAAPERALQRRRRPVARPPARRPPSSGGPGLVHRPHPGEVAREGRLAGEQRAGERVDLHRRRAAGRGAARSRSSTTRSTRSRSSTASRRRGSGRPSPNPRGGGARRGASGTSSAAYGRRVLGAEQVGPPDRPDQQRAPGQQQERLVGARRVGDGIADVLRRVPGRVERPEADRSRPRTPRRRGPAGARGRARRRPR